jgi:hypothetical protein
MANSSEVRTGISQFLQKQGAKRAKSLLFNLTPTLDFLFMLAGTKTDADGIGRPKSDAMLAALKGVAQAKKLSIYAAREYLPLIHTYAPSTSSVKAMSDHDSNPVVSDWDSTGRTLTWFKQPRVKFARFKNPWKVAHSDVRTAKSGTGGSEAQAAASIGSVYDVQTKTAMEVLCKDINHQLWGVDDSASGGKDHSTGVPTNEDLTQWDRLHSFAAMFSESNTYCGIDRSLAANAWWRGHTISTATAAKLGDIIDYCNYDLGMIDKGLGVQLIPTGKAIFKKFKAEAKAESYQLINSSIPEFAERGFKREVIRVYSGNVPVYCYYEPACPASVVVAMDPSTITFAIHPDANFAVKGPFDQDEVEGGDEADTGYTHAELMMVNEVPSSGAYFSNVA